MPQCVTAPCRTAGRIHVAPARSLDSDHRSAQAVAMEVVVIGLIRVVGSLPVLRWAFVGGLIAVFVDLSDLFWMNLLDLGGLGNYQQFDKIADQVYLVTFLVVAVRWAGPARTIAVALFGFRLVGFVIFEIVDDRAVLLFFPNVFEFWFLFVASLPHWHPGFTFTRGRTVGWMSVLFGLKEFQEYALHWAKWLDDFTAVEAVEAIADWVAGPFS
jgi:hypothetical protein